MGDIRVIYTSTAVSGLEETRVQDILRLARAHNALMGVSGVLVFDGARFLQLLEGQRPTLSYLVNAIARDGRHHDFTILNAQRIDHRDFTRWDMGYLDARVQRAALCDDKGLLPDWRELSSVEILGRLRLARAHLPDPRMSSDRTKVA